MAITLTETEFEVAWEAMRLGDLPLIFRVCVSRRGQTDEERARIVEDTLGGLRKRRLAGRYAGVRRERCPRSPCRADRESARRDRADPAASRMNDSVRLTDEWPSDILLVS